MADSAYITDGEATLPILDTAETMSPRTAALVASMRKAFADTCQAIPSDDDLALGARFVGDLSLDVALSNPDLPAGAERVLRAYRAALAEVADPMLRVARLRREEAALRAAADYHLRLSAEYAGKAEHRRQQGVADLAADFQRRAEVNDSLSVEALDAAEAKAAEADVLAARLQRTAELSLVVA